MYKGPELEFVNQFSVWLHLVSAKNLISSFLIDQKDRQMPEILRSIDLISDVF